MLEHLLHIFILGMNGDNTDSQKLNKIISEIQALQEVVARFRQLRLDATEFACLKCIVTFKAGKQIQTAVSSSSFAIFSVWLPSSMLPQGLSRLLKLQPSHLSSRVLYQKEKGKIHQSPPSQLSFKRLPESPTQ